MPSSTASVMPSALTCSTNAFSSGACSSIFSLIVSQPSRLPISGTPGPPQSDSSCCQTRFATPSDWACSIFAIRAGSRSSGIDERIVGGRPVTRPSRVSSTPATSLSNGSMNLSIASRSSVFVTSPMSMPASASAASSAPGSWSAVGPVTSSSSAQAPVDLGVHTRYEEAGHRVHVHRLARVEAALHAPDIGLGHRDVRLDREQQSDVDVDALGDRLLDRRHALLGARDLDHHVGPVDAGPEVARLRERGLRVVRVRRLHFDRHEAVVVLRPVPDGAEHVAGELHVRDGDLLGDRERVEALLGQLGDLLVVVGRAEDRLLEDGRVGGHAAQRALAHEARELAAHYEAAADLVEPNAGAGGGERGEALVYLGLDAHVVLAPSRSTTARPWAATFSGVKPKCSYRSFCGADAPKLVMPTWAPSSVVQRSHPKVAAASTDTRARTDGGSTASRYSSSCSAKRSRHGADTTLVAIPSASSRSAAPVQMCTSEPVPIRIRSGSPSRNESRST